MDAIFDTKAASCVPAFTLLVCLGILYLLDSAVIHIPYYEDFEFLALIAVFTFIAGLYSAHSRSYHFVAASLSGLTAFLILRAVFLYQQFLNRCDSRNNICAISQVFRLSTTLAFFLTLVPCAGLYGAAVYVFLNSSPPSSSLVSSPVVIGQPTLKLDEPSPHPTNV